MRHDVSLIGRQELRLSGVREVLGYNGEAIDLQTVVGQLNIRGHNLKIVSFRTETGDAEISGHITALVYVNEKAGKESLLSRLFR